MNGQPNNLVELRKYIFIIVRKNNVMKKNIQLYFTFV